MTDQEITESARAWTQARLTDIAAEADLWRSRGRDWHERALCAVGAVMRRTSPTTPSYRDDFMREAFMSYCSAQGGAQTLAHRERRDALLASKTTAQAIITPDATIDLLADAMGEALKPSRTDEEFTVESLGTTSTSLGHITMQPSVLAEILHWSLANPRDAMQLAMRIDSHDI